MYLAGPIERVEWFIDIGYSSFLVIALTMVDVGVLTTLQKLGTVDTQIYGWHVLFYSMDFILPVLLVYIQERLIPLLCWVFFIAGLEDTLFYLFQFGYLPVKFYGIKLLGFVPEPDQDTFLFVNMLGIILIVAYLAILDKISRVRKSANSNMS